MKTNMKKTIILVLAAIVSVTTFCQTKDTVKQQGNKQLQFQIHSNNNVMARSNGKDTLVIEKATFLTIDSVTVSYRELQDYVAQKKQNKIPLYVTPDWIALNWQFLQKASNPGLTGEQMDFIKTPMIPWIQAIMQAQQRQQQAGPPKQ